MRKKRIDERIKAFAPQKLEFILRGEERGENNKPIVAFFGYFTSVNCAAWTALRVTPCPLQGSPGRARLSPSGVLLFLYLLADGEIKG